MKDGESCRIWLGMEVTAIGYEGRNSGMETPLNFYLVRPIVSGADRKSAERAA